MNVKFKYLFLCLNIILLHFGTNSGFVIKYTDEVPSEHVRIKRQAGYVYDKPNVSFDLPTATSIATTQAPTVDRTQMQMYYAYPVPASGDNTVVQNTGATAGATAVATSGSGGGYNYGIQNAQVTGSRTTTTRTQNTASTSYQNTANTGYQTTAVSGTQVSSGYGDDRPKVSSGYGDDRTKVSSGYGDDRPKVSSGYGDGRPAITNTVSTEVSTSAPRYLPPTNSVQNTVVTSVATNEAQTGVIVTKPADNYIPPVQVSSPQNQQTVVTQTATNVVQANPNTSYLAPSPQPTPKVLYQAAVQAVPKVPTQQYLPPVESSGQTTNTGTVAAPAATYLPPVF